MKDWKGNEIKVGHTVIRMAIKQILGDGDITFAISHSSGYYEEIATFKNQRQYLWEPIQKAKIVDGFETNLSYNRMDDEIPICVVDFDLQPQSWEIICIEGISDNKEEYYLHEFGE